MSVTEILINCFKKKNSFAKLLEYDIIILSTYQNSNIISRLDFVDNFGVTDIKISKKRTANNQSKKYLLVAIKLNLDIKDK